MGTTQKLLKGIFGKQDTDKKTAKTYTPKPITDEERITFSKQFKPKNNRKRTPGRKFHYQPINNGRSSIKQFEHESR